MMLRKNNQNIPELLSPAGNLEKGKVAIDFGADAVFIGGKWFSLRAKASNFGKSEISEIVKYAKSKDKVIYVAANIFCHNIDLRGAERYLQFLKDTGVSAIIVADPYLIEIAKKIDLEIHISTQQSITNSAAARFWFRNGAPRVVTAREVTGQELKTMIAKTPHIDYEYFIHGAVCIAYSGRCTMSNHLLIVILTGEGVLILVGECIMLKKAMVLVVNQKKKILQCQQRCLTSWRFNWFN